MNKWLNKRSLIFAFTAGIFITLALGYFSPFRQSIDPPVTPDGFIACMTQVAGHRASETTRGKPFHFLRQVDFCGESTYKWLPRGLIGDIVVWTAASYLIALVYLKLYRMVYERVK